MSMTRDEAIEFLSQYIDNECYTEKCQEAHRMAITVLRPVSREQVERMRGEWRSIHGLSEYYCSRCGEEFEIHAYDKEKYRFCPHCMVPMTDEAVEIRLKELEALYGQENT